MCTPTNPPSWSVDRIKDTDEGAQQRICVPPLDLVARATFRHLC